MRHHVAAVTVAVLLSACVTRPALSDGAGKFEGKWISVTINGTQQVAVGCRYLEVETRRYDLTRNLDGKAAGAYFLMRERWWIGQASESCEIPGHGALSSGYARNDMWSLIGSLDSAGALPLSAVHLKCLGECKGPAPDDQFRVTLKFEQPGAFTERMDSSPQDAHVFTDLNLYEQRQQQAAAAFRPLLQPILDGNCNRFYQASLDPAARQLVTVNQDVYCLAVKPMGVLLRRLTVDEPQYSFVATRGVVLPNVAPPNATPIVLAGDAVVRRFLSNPDGSGGVPVTLLLRQQPDGTWRVRFML